MGKEQERMNEGDAADYLLQGMPENKVHPKEVVIDRDTDSPVTEE